MFSLSSVRSVRARVYYLSHALISLSNTGTDRFQIKQSLCGHHSRRVLSRAVLLEMDNTNLCALACDESANRAVAWDLSSLQTNGKFIPLNSHPTPVLDVCVSQNLVFSLSRSLVHMYHVSSTVPKNNVTS